MSLLIVVLAILLILIGFKVKELSEHLNLLRNRLELAEKRLSEFARSLHDLRSGSRVPQEPIVSMPAPIEQPLPIEKPVPPASAPTPAPTTVAVPAAPPQIPLRPSAPQPPPAEKTAPAITPPKPASPPVPLRMSEQSAPRTPVDRTPVYRAPERTLSKFDWENVVGVKLFSWIAGIALLLAVVFFLRYSINQGWLIPKVRMVIGILTGLILLVLCEFKAARKYPVTANAMDASAIAILFSTFFAARALWDLIPVIPAFALMVLVTALAVVLSIRRDSVFIALLGLLGGFATPALLSTGENKPISLFTYLIVLNAGLAYVASRKKWPLLTTVSLVFTVVYQWGWVVRFLGESQLPLAIGIFAAFPILAFVMAAVGRKEKPQKDWMSLYGQTANLTALLPLLFTLYMAAVPAYGHRFVLLFGFLFLLDAGLYAIAVARGPEILHGIGGISTLLVSAIWLNKSYQGEAWPAILAFVALFVFFYLAAPLIAQYFGKSFGETGKIAAYTAPLLLFIFPALAAMEPACAKPAMLFGILFLLLLGVSASAIFAEEGALYYLASLFALLAEAIWSYKYLSPERLIPGLVLYGVFGLLYIAVPVLALKWRKRFRPEEAGAGIQLISIALLFFFAVGQIAPAGIWGLALLLLALNAGLLWQDASFKVSGISMAGIVLSWIILGTLWSSLSLSTILIPALTVMTVFALFVLCGSLWLQKQAPGDGLAANGIFLGLAGHIFLFAIAVQRSLSVPPWPFLCVLLILDLGIGLSALYLRRNNLHQAAMAASAILLMIWVWTARDAPWPVVSILSAGALSLFSFIWIYLARRAGIRSWDFPRTAAIAVILSQFTAILASALPGAPGVKFLLGAHLVFLIALLGLAWAGKMHEYAVIAVFPAALAPVVWRILHWGAEFWPQLFLFAIPIYLVFIAYPLLLGKRSYRFLNPFLAAVLASVPFFFLARDAMLDAGWKPVIGILPVSQALLLGALVLLLLKIERPGERTLGRLALVAGAALAFITVAIPLQLEKHWITIGWALEAAALSWLYRKVPHKGLLGAATGLFTAVFIRLALNPFVLTYGTRSAIPLWNWYLYTYLTAAAAFIIGGRFLAKTDDRFIPETPRISNIVPGGAIILLFLLLNIEIADYYSVGPTITFNFSATLAQDLTYTLAWALFAVGLLAIGIAIKSQAARIASLALLVVTIVKCFIHDFARLGELYRVGSFVGLGICLALVALALQKFVLSARKQEK
jgi:uncharacterized membrane protein